MQQNCHLGELVGTPYADGGAVAWRLVALAVWKCYSFWQAAIAGARPRYRKPAVTAAVLSSLVSSGRCRLFVFCKVKGSTGTGNKQPFYFFSVKKKVWGYCESCDGYEAWFFSRSLDLWLVGQFLLSIDRSNLGSSALRASHYAWAMHHSANWEF